MPDELAWMWDEILQLNRQAAFSAHVHPETIQEAMRVQWNLIQRLRFEIETVKQ